MLTPETKVGVTLFANGIKAQLCVQNLKYIFEIPWKIIYNKKQDVLYLSQLSSHGYQYQLLWIKAVNRVADHPTSVGWGK